MSHRSHEYWKSVSFERDPIAFEAIPSMHPVEMWYRLNRDALAKKITPLEEVKQKESTWGGAWMMLSYDVLGLDMELKLYIRWTKFTKDGQTRYAWSMDMDPIIFNDETLNGHLKELYSILLEFDDEIYKSHLFYQSGGFHMADHIMNPHKILQWVDDFVFAVIGGWNEGWSLEETEDKPFFDLCGDDSFVKASDAFRYCMGTYREQWNRWGALCASMD